MNHIPTIPEVIKIKELTDEVKDIIAKAAKPASGKANDLSNGDRKKIFDVFKEIFPLRGEFPTTGHLPFADKMVLVETDKYLAENLIAPKEGDVIGFTVPGSDRSVVKLTEVTGHDTFGRIVIREDNLAVYDNPLVESVEITDSRLVFKMTGYWRIPVKNIVMG